MALITFQDLPNTTTPLNASNLNNNFNELDTKIDGIIESGSNANGNYIKFSDGTLIQWNSMTVQDQAMSSSYGSAYQGSRVITFPVDFYDTNYSPHCSHFLYGTGASWGSVANKVSKSQMTIRGMDFYSRTTGTNCHISWMAIGKWK